MGVFKSIHEKLKKVLNSEGDHKKNGGSLNVKGGQQDTSKEPNTKADDKKLVLLMDFCKRRVATVGGDGYTETVLYRREPDLYEIHTYRKYEYMPEMEHYAYRTTEEVWDNIQKYLKKHNVSKYEKKQGMPVCGGVEVVKFLVNGRYVRLTTSNFDTRHTYILSDLSTILNEAIDPEKEI